MPLCDQGHSRRSWKRRSVVAGIRMLPLLVPHPLLVVPLLAVQIVQVVVVPRPAPSDESGCPTRAVRGAPAACDSRQDQATADEQHPQHQVPPTTIGCTAATFVDAPTV